jgi:hypothetical protein
MKIKKYVLFGVVCVGVMIFYVERAVICKETVAAYLSCHPRTRLQRMRKTTKQ